MGFRQSAAPPDLQWKRENYSRRMQGLGDSQTRTGSFKSRDPQISQIKLTRVFSLLMFYLQLWAGEAFLFRFRGTIGSSHRFVLRGEFLPILHIGSDIIWWVIKPFATRMRTLTFTTHRNKEITHLAQPLQTALHLRLGQDHYCASLPGFSTTLYLLDLLVHFAVVLTQ